MGETVVFDLETQHAIQAVGGVAHLDQLRVSVAVAYEVNARRFHHFEEPRVPDLIALLITLAVPDKGCTVTSL